MDVKRFFVFVLSAVAFPLIFWGCTQGDPDIGGVIITPATASVPHGGGESFAAVVEDENDQRVTWKVEGGVPGTTINSVGRLAVALNETASTLTVRATSVANSSKSGKALVTVTSASASVTGVTISPKSANVDKGDKRHFSATVAGQNNPAKTVTWTVTGGISSTTISDDGLLTISANETAASLTVKAVSTVDTTKSDTATVTVGARVTPTDNRILDPAAATQLSGYSLTVNKPHGGGNKALTGVPYGYETWDEDSSGNAVFYWYGANQGGGAAFRAEWGNTVRPKDFLARVGYFWNETKPHTAYGNIYCGFNFTKSGQYKGNFSYIGIYGWSKNPTVEYYIVENSYGNAWNTEASYISNIEQTIQGGSPVATYNLDGENYKVYKKSRTGPSIVNNNDNFTQFFSIRQTPRTSGKISITRHFEEWDKLGMELGTNMYECKFKVEVGGTPSNGSASETGWFDAKLIQFYRANDDGSIIQIYPQ